MGEWVLFVPNDLYRGSPRIHSRTIRCSSGTPVEDQARASSLLLHQHPHHHFSSVPSRLCQTNHRCANLVPPLLEQRVAALFAVAGGQLTLRQMNHAFTLRPPSNIDFAVEKGIR